MEYRFDSFFLFKPSSLSECKGPTGTPGDVGKAGVSGSEVSTGFGYFLNGLGVTLHIWLTYGNRTFCL